MRERPQCTATTSAGKTPWSWVPGLRENGIGIVNETHWIDSDLKKHHWVTGISRYIPIEPGIAGTWIRHAPGHNSTRKHRNSMKSRHENSPSRMPRDPFSCAQLLFLTLEALQDFLKSLGPNCFHQICTALYYSATRPNYKQIHLRISPQKPRPRKRIPSRWYGPTKRKTIINII